MRRKGFSTGIAIFDVGGVLPYNKHPFGEAVTILSGIVRLTIEGRCYTLAPFDCIHLPPEVAHEVMNCSRDSMLVILSAFAFEGFCCEEVNDEFAGYSRGRGRV